MSPSKRQPTATLDESTTIVEPLTLVLPPDVQDGLPDDRDQLPTVLARLTLPVAEGEDLHDEPAAPALEPVQSPQPLECLPPPNDVLLVGRVLHHQREDHNSRGKQNQPGNQNQRGTLTKQGPPPRRSKQSGRFTKLHKGGDWLEYTLQVAEEIVPGVVAVTQIPFLIPSGRHDLKQRLHGDHLVRVQGRLDRDAEFDTRYGKQTDQGGTIAQRVFIKAATIDVVEKPNAPAMHAMLRLTGTVRRVVQVARKLGQHDIQKFHIVSILVVEHYPRQEPARGMVTYEQTLRVAVPVGDTDTLRYLLRAGNPVALELSYRTINDWVKDDHHSLEGVDPKQRDRLRKQSRSFLTVIQATPLNGAASLTDAEMATILSTARAQQKNQQEKQEQRRREQRAAASPLM